MTATVNGESRTMSEGATLAEVFRDLALDPRGIAVALNDVVVSRSRYAECTVREGDRIEIIHAVAGG